MSKILYNDLIFSIRDNSYISTGVNYVYNSAKTLKVETKMTHVPNGARQLQGFSAANPYWGVTASDKYEGTDITPQSEDVVTWIYNTEKSATTAAVQLLINGNLARSINHTITSAYGGEYKIGLGGSASYKFASILHYVKIWVDDELVRYMIPCTDNSNNGLYDIVNNKMYLREGTGAFMTHGEIDKPSSLFASITDNLTNNTVGNGSVIFNSNNSILETIKNNSITKFLQHKIKSYLSSNIIFVNSANYASTQTITVTVKSPYEFADSVISITAKRGTTTHTVSSVTHSGSSNEYTYTATISLSALNSSQNYYITITITDNNKTLYTKTLNLSYIYISKTIDIVTTPVINSATMTYSGNSQNLLSTAGSCSTGGSIRYFVDTRNDTPRYDDTSWSTTYAVTNAGTYHIWYSIISTNSNYTASTDVIYLGSKTINKQTISISAPSMVATTLAYTGNSQYLVNIGSVSPAAAGTMYYYVSNTNTTPSASASGWSTTRPSGTNAATYYIWYKVDLTNTANYSGAINPTLIGNVVIAQIEYPQWILRASDSNNIFSTGAYKEQAGPSTGSELINYELSSDYSENNCAYIHIEQYSGQPVTVNNWTIDPSYYVASYDSTFINFALPIMSTGSTTMNMSTDVSEINNITVPNKHRDINIIIAAAQTSELTVYAGNSANIWINTEYAYDIFTTNTEIYECTLNASKYVGDVAYVRIEPNVSSTYMVRWEWYENIYADAYANTYFYGHMYSGNTAAIGAYIQAKSESTPVYREIYIKFPYTITTTSTTTNPPGHTLNVYLGKTVDVLPYPEQYHAEKFTGPDSTNTYYCNANENYGEYGAAYVNIIPSSQAYMTDWTYTNIMLIDTTPTYLWGFIQCGNSASISANIYDDADAAPVYRSVIITIPGGITTTTTSTSTTTTSTTTPQPTTTTTPEPIVVYWPAGGTEYDMLHDGQTIYVDDLSNDIRLETRNQISIHWDIYYHNGNEDNQEGYYCEFTVPSGEYVEVVAYDYDKGFSQGYLFEYSGATTTTPQPATTTTSTSTTTPQPTTTTTSTSTTTTTSTSTTTSTTTFPPFSINIEYDNGGQINTDEYVLDPNNAETLEVELPRFCSILNISQNGVIYPMQIEHGFVNESSDQYEESNDGEFYWEYDSSELQNIADIYQVRIYIYRGSDASEIPIIIFNIPCADNTTTPQP